MRRLPCSAGAAETGAGAQLSQRSGWFRGLQHQPDCPRTADHRGDRRWQACPPTAGAADAKIAGWASTLRQQVTVRPSPADPLYFGDYVQVDRVGNPLTVEALIPLPMKDYWNRSQPSRRPAVRPIHRKSVLRDGILNGVFGLQVPPAPRNDLLGVYVPDITRIDLTIAPTPLARAEPPGPTGRRQRRLAIRRTPA